MTKSIVAKNKWTATFFILQFLIVVFTGSLLINFVLAAFLSPLFQDGLALSLFPFFIHPLAPYVWIFLMIINLMYIFIFQQKHKLHGKLKMFCYLAVLASILLLVVGAYITYSIQQWLL